jgi:hypothetical protein
MLSFCLFIFVSTVSSNQLNGGSGSLMSNLSIFFASANTFAEEIIPAFSRVSLLNLRETALSANRYGKYSNMARWPEEPDPLDWMTTICSVPCHKGSITKLQFLF